MFEVVREELKKWDLKEEDIIIPTRKTIDSAGYDFHIPYNYKNIGFTDYLAGPKQSVLVPTGVKCKFSLSKQSLFLQISLKSGFASKNNVLLKNAPGVVDMDYYSNPDNDGHILLSLYNYGQKDLILEPGKGIAQGIFIAYHTFGEIVGEQRIGGFGSTK